MSQNEYPAPERQVTSDDLAAWLIPDSPAALTKPEPRPMPTTAELLAAWEQQQRQADGSNASAALVPHQTTEVPAIIEPEAGPVVPRWAWVIAARLLVAATVAAIVAFVVWGVSMALAAAASAVAAAAPVIGACAIGAGVLLLLCRRRPGSVTVTQTMTQTVRVRR